MVIKLDSYFQLINYAWDFSNLWRNGWYEMKLGTYIKWGMLSPNMVIKLVSDCQLINYAWDLSNLWRSGWNEIKLVTYIKWGILSPNMVMKLDSDCQLINYAWDFSNLWNSGWNEMNLGVYQWDEILWIYSISLCMRYAKMKLGTYIKWGMLIQIWSWI